VTRLSSQNISARFSNPALSSSLMDGYESTSSEDDDDDLEEFMRFFELWDAFEEEDEAVVQHERWLYESCRTILAAGTAGREIQAAARRTTRRFLRRADLLPDPKGQTSWMAIFNSRADHVYITTMGLDVATFDLLLDSGFRQNWMTRTVSRDDVNTAGFSRRRRRLLEASGGLGLVLHYLNSAAEEVELQMIFALTPSSCSRYIRFGLNTLSLTLSKMPAAQIRWPTERQMQEYSDMIETRHGSILRGGFGFVDGLNLKVQTSSDPMVENMTYNGWLHGHFISSVIAFAPTGEIIYLVTNCPGSWHDAKIASSLYDKLQERTNDPFFLLADTAFPRSDSLRSRIKSPLKTNVRLPTDARERAAALDLSAEVTSARQAAEWGMRAIQGSFGRLSVPLPIEDDRYRAQMLLCCFRLHQLRVRCVGINQIKTVYDPLWQNSPEQALVRLSQSLFDRRRNDRVARFHVVADERGYTVRHN